MKRLVAFLLVALLWLSRPIVLFGSGWGTAKGFNFRATLGFVTDPTNTQFTTDTDTYPTTKTIGGDSVTYGWTSAPSGSRDRDNTIDARLAGVVFNQSSASAAAPFRIDLPASGSFTIDLAMGDAGSSQSATKITIKDNTTVLATIGPDAPSTQQFYDATDVLRATAAAWVSNEVSITKTFSTTTFLLTLELPTSASSVIAHLKVTQNAASGCGSRPGLTLLGVGNCAG